MMTNTTRLPHGSRSRGHIHGHGVRSSIASVLRRKGSALASLSALFQRSKSNHNREQDTHIHTWDTDPSENRPSLERPLFHHLEHTRSPPYGSWSAGRKRAHPHQKKQFWTVSGTRSRARSSLTETGHVPRMSKARSFVHSLRNRGALLEEYDTFQEDGGNCDEESCQATAPVLEMPHGCAGQTETSSSFVLGVQNALRDTVDETSSLREDSHSQPSASTTDSHAETISTSVPRSSSNVSPLSSLEFNPRDIAESLSWICHSREQPAREKGVLLQDSVIRTLIQAYEYLDAKLQGKKMSHEATPEQLTDWDRQLSKLRALIDFVSETRLSVAHNNGPQDSECQRELEKGKGKDLPGGAQTAGGPENEYSCSEQSGTCSDEDSDPRWSSNNTSVESEGIPGPPASPEPGFEGYKTTGNKGKGFGETRFESSMSIKDECPWEMRCTQKLLEAQMRLQHPQVNPDA